MDNTNVDVSLARFEELRNASSGNHGGAFKNTLNLEVLKKGDNEIPFFDETVGVHTVLIVPYVISSELNPLLYREGSGAPSKIGDLDVCLDYWVHRFAGENQIFCICPKKNYDKKCPICAKSWDLYNKAKADNRKMTKVEKSYMAKQRVLYNILEVKGNSLDPVMKLFDVSYFLFHKGLFQAWHVFCQTRGIKMSELTKFLVQFSIEKTTKDGMTFSEFSGFQFHRFEGLTNETRKSLIKSAYPLDKAIVLHKYETIQRQLEAGIDDSFGSEDDSSYNTPSTTPSLATDKEQEKLALEIQIEGGLPSIPSNTDDPVLNIQVDTENSFIGEGEASLDNIPTRNS